MLNLLIGGSDVGDGIVNHPNIDAITFTGSTGIGRRIASIAAARGVPVQAEMGGKNAAVVLHDADFDLALDQVMLGAFRSTGQKCTATSRLIVTDGIADRFLDALAERTRALVVGNPVQAATHMGPVVSDSARKTITTGIDTARTQGATILAGGAPYTDDARARGYFIAPTVAELGDQPADVWTDELFGPVLAVRRATDARKRSPSPTTASSGCRRPCSPKTSPGSARHGAHRRRRAARQLRIGRRRPARTVRRR